MDERRRLSLIVGAFVVGSMVMAAAALLTLGSRGGLLNPRYRLVTYFENVQGLVAGAPVRLVGKDVGTVEFVTFAPIGREVPAVRVVMQVDASVQDRVRSDSVAAIGTIGLLGDKYVELSMGTPLGRILQEGDEIASVSPLDLNVAIVRGTEAIDNIATLARNVNRVVEEFGDSMGGRQIGEAASSLTAIVNEIREGQGLLHSLIYDSYEGSGVRSVEGGLANLEGILAEIANGDGLLHSLIYDPPGEIELVTEAERAGVRLNSILAKIDEAEGTAGLLVNDPTLYDDLVSLVGGAQRSLVVRSLIRLSTDADE